METNGTERPGEVSELWPVVGEKSGRSWGGGSSHRALLEPLAFCSKGSGA